MESNLFPVQIIKDAIKEPAFEYSGVRKLLRHGSFELDFPPKLTYELLGYKQNKIKQMERNYYNQAEFDRVRKVLARRDSHKNTSVALAMRGKEKDERSQGWCMLNVVITRAKGYEAVDVFYRSTEIVLKFGADLVFLPWVLSQIGVDTRQATFHLANYYLSGVFLPTLAQFWEPIDMLEYLWKHDRPLFAGGTRFFLRSTYANDQKFKYSPEDQQHRLLWSRFSPRKIKEIRDYLIDKHKTTGKPLPVRADPRGK